MRKLLLLCCCAALLAGCAPTGDPMLRARDERNYPDPALGPKNSESETYSAQQLASPPSTPAAQVPSAPVAKPPVTAPGK
jgi:hypothetical protein